MRVWASLQRRAFLGAALLVGLVSGAGWAEPFAFVDETGHTTLGHGSPPEHAVQGVDGLRSLWKGRVTGSQRGARGDRFRYEAAGWREAQSRNFHVWLDARLGDGREPSIGWAFDTLETARSKIEAALGEVPRRRLNVVLYALPTYARLYRERFGFETVGFFDGTIHVVAPPGNLSLLGSRIRHEYAHAVFRDRVGGDRPYWLNEGFALQLERSFRGQPRLDAEERAMLRRRVREGRWIPMSRLVEDFSSLRVSDAWPAYLQSALALEWLEEHTGAGERDRLLMRLGEGVALDEALYEAVGVDAGEFDRRLQRRARTDAPDRVSEKRD